MYSLSNIAASDDKYDYLDQSKGHVLTVFGYEGQIELVNNTFSKNMAFIPSAIVSNLEKFNSSLITFNNEFFKVENEQYMIFSKMDH